MPCVFIDWARAVSMRSCSTNGSQVRECAFFAIRPRRTTTPTARHTYHNTCTHLASTTTSPALDWPNLHNFRAPHIPKGSSRMKKMLSELQDTPRDSDRYNELVRSITANFDDFKESSSQNVFNKHSDHSGKHVVSSGHNSNEGGVGASKQEADAAFLNYTYKRRTVSVLWCYCLCYCVL